MTLNDILTLLNAGYTKEDIDKLDPTPAPAPQDPAQAPAPDPIPAPAPQDPAQAPAPDPTPAPAPDPTPAPAPQDPAQAIKTVLDDFTKKLQAFQVATSNMIPKPDDTGESVFAEIIAPTKRKD